MLYILLRPTTMLAHGFGERIDLPVPFGLYMLGAAITVAVSFIAIGLLAQHKRNTAYPSYDISRLVQPIEKPGLVLLKTLSIIMAGVVVCAGPLGSPIPSYNIAPVTVWILFGVGMVYFSSCIGNIWDQLHPSGILVDCIRWLKPRSHPDHWPTTLQYWPAFIGYFAFRWIENVYPYASRPEHISLFVFWYLAVSFMGMLLAGKKRWLTYCDPFSVFFRFLSYCSVTEFVNGNYKLRLPCSGLLTIRNMTVSQIVFEMVMLSGITFDGMKETAQWTTVHTTLLDLGFSKMYSLSLGFVLFLIGFVIIYFFFCYLIHLCSDSQYTTLSIASSFALSLLPIAVAYEIAHYISLFLIEGQRAIYLLSDPFGLRWNIFGTAGYEVQYEWINYSVLWNVQVAIILLGHIVSVYIAHIRALDIFPNHHAAVRSQYPLIILMVLYTVCSLWIIGQPLVE